MYQRVTFYADDNSKRKLDCYFQSKKAFDKFLDIINKADYTIMTYDLWDDVIIMKHDYPLIPGNVRGFKMVMKSLYPAFYS